MKAAIRIFLLLCCFAMSGVTAGELTIIELRHRPAEELLPILQPMVGPGVALSGMDYKLLVRGNPGDVARIRELLAVLDRAARQLLVSVRYADGAEDRSAAIAADADIWRHDTTVDVRAGASTGAVDERSLNSVRVLEGNVAHISAGQSVPFVTMIAAPRHRRAGGQGVATEYRDLSSGFDVLPRVNGERVVLQISGRQQRLVDAETGSAAVQYVDTTITGRLGEWIDLGEVSSSVEERHSTTGGSGGRDRTMNRSASHRIAVKVEAVD